MIASGFTAVLTGSLSSRLAWQPAHKCPCATSEGSADPTCVICGGEGLYWDAMGAPFRAGLTGLSARDLEMMRTRLGPGLIGDAMVSLPAGCPPYIGVQPGDRFLALDNLDSLEWTVRPGVPLRLPPNAVITQALARSSDGTLIVAVTPPTIGGDGSISVSAPMTLRFTAPRRFQVISDFMHIRNWVSGLPKRLTLKLIDQTVR